MEEAEQCAFSKVYWRVLPILALGYGIAYMDRANISFAALQMNSHLGFDARVYGLGAGLFFVGYAALEVPSNLALLRLGARRWISTIMVLWGILAAATMLVTTPGQLYAMRFLLGAAEAGFFPAIIFYLMAWFPKSQRARAISRFYIALPLSTAVMGIIAGPLLGLDGTFDLRGWQWLFLIEGIPAIVLGFFISIFLPEAPAEAKWLTDKEKEVISSSLQLEASDETSSIEPAIWTTLKCPKFIILSAINFINLAGSYAFVLSVPELIQDRVRLDIASIGYVTAGVGLLGGGAMLMAGLSSDIHKERYRHIMVLVALVSAGYFIMALTESAWLFMGSYVVVWCATVAFQTIFFVVPTEISEGKEAAVGIALVNSVGMCGAFVGPYIWGYIKAASGDYRPGLLAISASFFIALYLIALFQRHCSGTIRVDMGASA